MSSKVDSNLFLNRRANVKEEEQIVGIVELLKKSSENRNLEMFLSVQIHVEEELPAVLIHQRS